MIYLIDGHNLIGQIPDIDLADPDDEAKLVRRLQNWAAGDRKRRIQLIFDNGEFGGVNPQLTTSNIRVMYARLGRTADDELIRLLNQLKNPPEYTLVTSDRAILTVARQRRVGYILSQEFAELMALEAAERLAPPPVPEPDPDLGARPEVDIAPDEVNEWLQVFNKPIPSTRTTPPPPSAAAVSKPSRPRSPQEMKADGRISEDDLAEWLGTFGDVPATGQPEPSAPASPTAPSSAQSAKSSAKPKPAPDPRPQKYTNDRLSPEDVAAWEALFQQKKAKD
jgi:uncharacterized protein